MMGGYAVEAKERRESTAEEVAEKTAELLAQAEVRLTKTSAAAGSHATPNCAHRTAGRSVDAGG